MKKILIVEDTKKHMIDAVKIAKEMGFEPVCAINYCEASNIIYRKEVDFVVTDLHLPVNEKDGIEAPWGINIALQSKKAGIPSVICTDDRRHGSKTQWLLELVGRPDYFGDFRLPRLINGSGADESKNWEYAIKWVTGQIER